MNQVWAIDVVHDACTNGQKLKCLMVTEELTRDGLAIEVAGPFRLRYVIAVLSRLVSDHGAPMFIRSDNGPELVSGAILKCITDGAT
jgi:putative transposase